MIRITVKGLAQFMTAGAAKQRQIPRGFKYPDEDESTARTFYYREARNGVRAYHTRRRDPRWLLGQAQAVKALGASLGGRSRDRLNNNARAFRQYHDHFSDRPFQILEDLSFDLDYHGVRIKVTPDLHVRENSAERIIKLEFSSQRPEDRTIKIISQMMFEAARTNGHNFTSAAVLYIDVPRAEVHKGARAGSRMTREVEAACQNIAAIWPTI